jgi:hypothetical protein
MSSNSGLPGVRISPNSWLAKRFAPKPPDAIICGVRVIEGAVDGEGSRWAYRLSAVDLLPVDGFITLTHGRTVLRVAGLDIGDARARPGYQVWTAHEIGGAGLLLATPPNQAWRLEAR